MPGADQRGSIILGVLMASTLIAGLAVLMTTNLDTGLKDQAGLREEQALAEHHQTVLAALRDPAQCQANFRNRTTHEGQLAKLVTGAGATGPLVSKGDLVAQGTMKLDAITVHDYRAYTTGAPDTRRGTLTLDLNYIPVNGGTPRRRPIILAVETFWYTGGAGAPHTIDTCHAIGGETDAWRITKSSDIYFGTSPTNTQRVGIGVFDPTEKLHVRESVIAKEYFHPSDVRLKDHVRAIDRAGAVNALAGVRYAWSDGGGRALGVIAQDVEREFPEVVRVDPRTGLKSVEYAQLLPLLIDRVNDLSARQRRLRHRLARLRR